MMARIPATARKRQEKPEVDGFDAQVEADAPTGVAAKSTGFDPSHEGAHCDGNNHQTGRA
jgi:hypothetical protein